MARVTTVNPNDVLKACAALNVMKRKDVPWYEQGMITEEMIREIAIDVLESADKPSAYKTLLVMKQKDVPGWAQGFVTDALLHELIDTVYNSVGRK